MHPESGGTYVYARERIGSFWGFLAGWGFLVGKTASLAAMALTFGAYAHPGSARPLGIGVVAVLTAVNYRGVEKTALLTRALVGLVLVILVVVVLATVSGGTASIERLDTEAPRGVLGVLQSAGLLFFAFAGYARIATLGEEVVDPGVTIPRAIPIALGVVITIYGAVLVAALLAVGPEALARSEAPLADAIESGRWSAITPLVRFGAALASAGVLLSLLAGVSRTALSMARRRDLPHPLAAVHGRYRTPHRAELATGVLVIAIVALADIRHAIGFSSFAVLTYYALTNASALTLSRDERRWPRWLAWIGLSGCIVLAVTLPAAAVIGGIALLVGGSLVWIVRSRL